MTEIPRVKLAHGAQMPVLGLGTWPMGDDEAARVVPQAVELGYRLVDTAENYRNESGVGAGLRAGGVPREELFVTTKFNVRWHGRDLVRQALDGSTQRLGLDYVDLLLIHWPNPGPDRYVGAWRGMVDLLEEGRVRAIGVSNFKPAHLERLRQETGVLPDVNQIQLSPASTRAESRAYHDRHGIVTQSWSPLGGERDRGLLRDPVVTGIAERIGRTPGQVVLRWHLQLGLTVIPKSSSPVRLAENADVFGWELSEADLAALAGLDRGESVVVDSDTFGH
ncbi:MAG TPA: aldo/keto reductase [Kineosporiaceae bacterium]|nr:aldo/keto reductase [Kineosporiaceae bacterium]